MQTVKLTAVGNSTGAIIPKEMLARMGVEKGDTLFAVETPQGFMLTPYDPEFARQMEIGQKFMNRYRETFLALAK